MSGAFEEFVGAIRAVSPSSALVLGSGLGTVADVYPILTSIAYTDIPGMAPPTVVGHRGRLELCRAGAGHLLVAHGRIHRYEGHLADRVTRSVRLFAEWGVKQLILTNAAGGIHKNLIPGELMVIEKHWKLHRPLAWKGFDDPTEVYSPTLLDRLRELRPAPRFGGYAALTGPSYETPAEIRALESLGVDAVGMSTAVEAEAAAALGLEVVAISCITNRAAGITPHPLSHREVEINAKLGVERLRALIAALIG